MKIEFLYSLNKCKHCNEGYQEVIHFLKDYPHVDELNLFDILDRDQSFFYDYSSKYGFIDVPLIIVNDVVIFNSLPGKKELYDELNKHKDNKCKTVDQDQMLLY